MKRIYYLVMIIVKAAASDNLVNDDDSEHADYMGYAEFSKDADFSEHDDDSEHDHESEHGAPESTTERNGSPGGAKRNARGAQQRPENEQRSPLLLKCFCWFCPRPSLF